MRWMIVAVLLALFGVGFVNLSDAQEDEIVLKPEAETLHGEMTLESGFSPQEFIVTMSTGGPVDVSYLGGKCVGFAHQSPSILLNWQGEGEYLQIHYVSFSNSDTALVVLAPDGNYYCDDDSLRHPHPMLEWMAAPAGEYLVWVANYNAGESTFGHLAVTQVLPEPFNDREVALNLSLPTYGTVSLEAGIGQRPYIKHIPQVSPDIRARTVQDECVGFISFAPSFRLRWQGEADFLRFYMESRLPIDSVMLIRDPAGNIYCDDDSYVARQPMITIPDPVAGSYDVWVGTYYPQFFNDSLIFVDDTITAQDQPQPPNQQLSPNLDSIVPTRNTFHEQLNRSQVSTGGAIDISYLNNSDCVGTASTVPDLSFELTQPEDMRDDFAFMFTFFGRFEVDTAIVVLDPLGQYHCSTQTRPAHGFDFSTRTTLYLEPMTGRYTVWLASQHPYWNNQGHFSVTLVELMDDDELEMRLGRITEEIDPSADPTYGTLILRDGFPSQPRQIGINHEGRMSIYLSCRANVNVAPDVRIEWQGEPAYMRLTFQRRRADIWHRYALLVQLPGGNYRCVTSEESMLELHMVFDQMTEGVYNIWIGTAGFMTGATGTLFITQEPLD